MKVLIPYSPYMVSFRGRHQAGDIPESALVFANQTCKEVRSKFVNSAFNFYETEFQAALVIIEQGRSHEFSSKKDNSPTKWETKKEIVLTNVVYNKIKLASSLGKSKSILERQRKMDCVDWHSDEHWDVEQLHRCDLPLITVTIERILCKHDCSMIPICNNQLGVWREIESLKGFWECRRGPVFSNATTSISNSRQHYPGRRY